MAFYITECSLDPSAFSYPMLPKKHSETANWKGKQKEHLQFLSCRDLEFMPQNVKASAGNATMRRCNRQLRVCLGPETEQDSHVAAFKTYEGKRDDSPASNMFSSTEIVLITELGLL